MVPIVALLEASLTHREAAIIISPIFGLATLAFVLYAVILLQRRPASTSRGGSGGGAGDAGSSPARRTSQSAGRR